MRPNASSKEIAEELGITQRHARRLRAQDDYRLEPIDHAWLARRRREEIEEEMQSLTFRFTAAELNLAEFLRRESPPFAAAARAELEKIHEAVDALYRLAPAAGTAEPDT